MYSEQDFELLVGLLGSTKKRHIKSLLRHTSFAKEFEHLTGGTPDEKIRTFIYQSFYEYAASDPDTDWYQFLFDEPLEEMPLYLNENDLRELFARWRLQIGK